MKLRRWFLIPDLHAPHHDKNAWALVLRAIPQWDPDGLCTMGDFGDVDCVSRFPKVKGRRMTLAEEGPLVRACLDELDALRIKENVFLTGNHEFRLERYVAEHPELIGTVDLESMLQLHKRRRWKVVPYGDAFDLGKLALTHDIGRSGANVARQQLADYGESIACGHSHRVQIVYGSTISSGPHVSASLGWLGDERAIEYRHRRLIQREWIKGVATVIVLPDDTFFLRYHPIVKGRLEIDGQVYE